ncbi:hypothetical protein GDO86_012210 [Hymenochirus boettgeri]|uniref:Uncharacterized protein n=1 Tax=Hymenochirus boettgeri TaxID=247094 RepID=A0A8T2ILP0_9PIPI|nr:hypothetical protein GDO86_012210 [Hymenochirus boettgeri]
MLLTTFQVDFTINMFQVVIWSRVSRFSSFVHLQLLQIYCYLLDHCKVQSIPLTKLFYHWAISTFNKQINFTLTETFHVL